MPARLAAILADAVITEPFPIQRDTLPDTLAGRNMLCQGRTGSDRNAPPAPAGEQRITNSMIWQAAYAELMFLDDL